MVVNYSAVTKFYFACVTTDEGFPMLSEELLGYGGGSPFGEPPTLGVCTSEEDPGLLLPGEQMPIQTHR